MSLNRLNGIIYLGSRDDSRDAAGCDSNHLIKNKFNRGDVRKWCVSGAIINIPILFAIGGRGVTCTRIDRYSNRELVGF